MPDDRNSFSVVATPECVETLRRWGTLIRDLRSRIDASHGRYDVSSEEMAQQDWFDDHDLAIAEALEALATKLEAEISRGSLPFEFEHTFTSIPGEAGADRIDLAFRITKVTSEVPITFVMRDKFLTIENESVFCEAYLSDGSIAQEEGGFLLGADAPPKRKSLLTPGAAVFLRDIPKWWNESSLVVDALAKLVKDCCKFDKGSKSRIDLTDAMSQMFDLIDTAERLLRRNRQPVTVTFSDATAPLFMQYLVELDGAVLSVSKKILDPCYTAVVLIQEKHHLTFLERLGLSKGEGTIMRRGF